MFFTTSVNNGVRSGELPDLPKSIIKYGRISGWRKEFFSGGLFLQLKKNRTVKCLKHFSSFLFVCFAHMASLVPVGLRFIVPQLRAVPTIIIVPLSKPAT